MQITSIVHGREVDFVCGGGVCVGGGVLTYINIRALTLETLLFKDSSTISILLSKTHISLDFPYKD
jgi:hypothetical protein